MVPNNGVGAGPASGEEEDALLLLDDGSFILFNPYRKFLSTLARVAAKLEGKGEEGVLESQEGI